MHSNQLGIKGSLLLLCLLVLSLASITQGNAQIIGRDIPIGTWRTHFSYTEVRSLEVTDEYVYAASSGGLFRYDREDGSIRSFSKIDGFSDANISTMRWVPEQRVLIIGYASGNIDLLRGESITNVGGITRANLVGSRRINHISYRGNLAYLSCEFGLVVLNIPRNELVASNSTLGSNGNMVAAKATQVRGDTLYLATGEGVKRVSLTRNLMNTQNYFSYGPAQGISNDALACMATWQGKVVVANGTFANDGQPSANNGCYVLENGRWNRKDFGIGRFQNMESFGDSLYICINSQLNVIGADAVAKQVTNRLFITLFDVAKDSDNHLWLADIANSLLGNADGFFRTYQSSGPAATSYVRIRSEGNLVLAASGTIDLAGYRATGNRYGYALFQNNDWRNVNAELRNIGFDATDVVDVAYNPVDGAYYAATYGKGIIIQQRNGTWDRLNERTPASTGLLSVVPGDSNFVRTTCVRVDPAGKVWMLNFGSNQGVSIIPLHRYDPVTGTMTAFRIPINGVTWENAMNMEIANNGDKWLVLADRRDINGTGGFNTVVGMVVVRADGTQARRITTTSGQGELPGDVVFDVAKDSQGAMWVAMNKGFGVFFNPASIFTNATYRISLPIINGRPVLENDVVRAIAIDGADRKWVASSTGVYLFDKDVTRVIANYTAANSPLISDNVNDIAINAITGEVFFSTDLGICSFRADASGDPANPLRACENMTIFPHPVPPGYEGVVSINGLPANSFVKITDLNGKLLWETRANGSTATWTGKDYNGQRAKTGIYNIFVASDDGANGCTNKIAVVE